MYEWPHLLEVFDGSLFIFIGALAACEVALVMLRGTDG